MQARGCQPVSDSVCSNRVVRCTIPAAAMLLSVLLTGCAPMPASESAAVSGAQAASLPHTQKSAGTRSTTELLSKLAPSPVRLDRLGDPAKAVEKNLYDLEWPQVDQQGIASWYGPGFHGRKTANGERFNQYELTAAHPTYEFGTQLCVRSTSTGQSVVVRVNDRGPFGKNRVIDLSKAAAEEIGLLGRGVKSVEIYKLDEGQEDCPEALLQARG